MLEQTESADVMRALWLHVGERWMRDFDWVLVFDTISFVVAENMRLLARTAENSAVAASPLHLWLRYDFRSAAARAHLLNRQGVARLAQALSAGAPSCKASGACAGWCVGQGAMCADILSERRSALSVCVCVCVLRGARGRWCAGVERNGSCVGGAGASGPFFFSDFTDALMVQSTGAEQPGR